MADGEQLDRSELLRRLVARIAGIESAHTTRVAIDGPDTAGKTTLADELADRLRHAGRDVIRASVDDFHRPRAERYRRGPDSPSGYYEDAFDYNALRTSLLEPLGPGGGGMYCTAIFDLRDDAPVEPQPAQATEGAVLLLDGVFLLRPALRDVWDLAIFISVGFDEVVRRAVRRDARLLGSVAEVERRYRTRYIPGQELYFAEANPQHAADVLIVNDDPSAPWLHVLRVDREPVRDPGTRPSL